MAITINGNGTVTGITSGAGKVLQVVQTIYDGKQSIASGSYVSTNVTASITPSSTSSKILVQIVVHTGMSGGNEGMHGRLYRNGSHVTGATSTRADGNRDSGWFHCGAHYTGSEQYAAVASYLDSPGSTSEQTYTVYARGHSSTYPVYINCSEGDGNENQMTQTISTMTLTEIQG